MDYMATKAKVFNVSNAEFQEYYNKNWDDCQSMWVSYKRDSYMHLANTTNKEKVTLSQSQKYTKMLKFCQKLAAIASQCGMPEFCGELSTVESIIESWDKNILFYIQKVRYV